MSQDLDVQSYKVDKLVKRINDGEIKIPPLQRSFVWDEEKIIRLLESIYNDYPVGSILLWETLERLPSVRNIAGLKLPSRPPTYPVHYVLDGQQRLSALYGVFSKNQQIDKTEDGYEIIKRDCFDIVFDLREEVFISSKEKDPKKKYIDLKGLLDAVEFNKIIRNFRIEKELEAAGELQSRFLNYEMPVVITKKRTLDEVGIIFERVNNSGTKLDLFDLMVAWTWTKSFHLKEEFNKIYDILSDKNFGGLEKKILLQCISVIIKESSKTKVIMRLKPDDIRRNLVVLKRSLEKTVDYLDTELSIRSKELLPHSHQIVPLCYFFSKINSPSEKQNRAIKQWFWKTSFSDRYSASTDQHIDDDIKSFIKLIKENKYNVFDKYSHNVTLDQLIDSNFRRSVPLARSFLVLLAQNKPLNLINGSKVDLGEALSSFNKKEYHHIFPKSFLRKKGVSLNKINSITNFCFLPSGSNKKVKDLAPSIYFKKFIFRNEQSEKILESNFLLLNYKIYRKDDYNRFLKERAQGILSFLEKTLIQ